MSTLRVVPDPADDAPVAAFDAGAPGLAAAVSDPAGTRWFPCTDRGVGAAVRTHVLTALNAWAVDTDTMADAMVLVSELVTNVRDHTASESLGVRVRVATNRVVVAIVEQVASDAPRGGRLEPTARDGVAPVFPLRDRGRGLQILDSMASEWGFVRSAGVSTAWFALAAHPPVAPDLPLG